MRTRLQGRVGAPLNAKAVAELNGNSNSFDDAKAKYNMLKSLAILLICANQASDLQKLQTQFKELSNLPWNERFERQADFHQAVIQYVQHAELKTGDEYKAVSDLLDGHTTEYEITRVQYELTYTAAALGNKQAIAKLGLHWDNLSISLGRNRTIGAMPILKSSMPPGLYETKSNGASIVRILMAPQEVDQSAKDNPEISKMFEEDQAVRQGPMDQKKIEEMVRGDQMRMARIKVLLKQGAVKSAGDFYRAAFLFQHGSSYPEYQIAHELSMCAMVLGHKGAKWIGAASYDRMLRSCGHKQRWGTQFRVSSGKLSLMPTDETGLSENQRKLVVGLTLAEARNRKLDP